MRRALVLFVVITATQATALAGRTGQARSAEVLAKRTAASPRGAREWGGKAAAYVTGARAQARKTMRASQPGAEELWVAIGQTEASTKIRQIVGKHLGLTPGQIASKDRRHDRAIKKQLRRMLRQVRTARSSGVPIYQAFPASISRTYADLESSLAGALARIDQHQVDNRRTTHPEPATAE